MKLIRTNQKGFTLIEIVIAIAITALVIGAVTGTIAQVFQSNRTTDHMVALRQVQTAGYWVSRDGLQAQQVVTGPDPGFPLTLDWVDCSYNDTHVVKYSVLPSGDLYYLQRKEVVNDDIDHPIITMVAQYIDRDNTSCEPADQELSPGETLTFTVTATMNQQTETRTYRVQPRPFT